MGFSYANKIPAMKRWFSLDQYRWPYDEKLSALHRQHSEAASRDTPDYSETNMQDEPIASVDFQPQPSGITLELLANLIEECIEVADAAMALTEGDSSDYKTDAGRLSHEVGNLCAVINLLCHHNITHPIPCPRREVGSLIGLIKSDHDLAKIACKALRFGLAEKRQGQDLTNAQRIGMAVYAVQGYIVELVNLGVLDEQLMNKGVASKVSNLRIYSRFLGQEKTVVGTLHTRLATSLNAAANRWARDTAAKLVEEGNSVVIVPQGSNPEAFRVALELAAASGTKVVVENILGIFGGSTDAMDKFLEKHSIVGLQYALPLSYFVGAKP